MFGKLPDNPFAAKMTRREREKGQTWFDVFGDTGAPEFNQKGYRAPPKAPSGAWGTKDFPEGGDPYKAAKDLLDGAERMYEQPEARELYFRDPSDPDMTMDIESEFHDIDDFIEYIEDQNDNLNFYMDVMNVPDRDGEGKPLELKTRLGIARRALDYVTLMRGGMIGEYGSDYTMIDPGKSRKGPAKPKYAREDEEGRLPKWAADAIFGDLLASLTPGYSTKLRLVNVDKDTARQFIEKHHSALPYLNPRGLLYAFGIKKGDRLVAVATASTPSAKWSPQPVSWADYRAGRERWVDPRNVMELTRVASDGSTKGAATMLVSRLMKLLPQSKRGDPDLPALFVTYQLGSEDGGSYRGLLDRGLRPVAFLPGKEPSGSRAGATEDKALARVDKIRWEYSPDPNTALPAKPALGKRKIEVEPTPKAEGSDITLNDIAHALADAIAGRLVGKGQHAFGFEWDINAVLRDPEILSEVKERTTDRTKIPATPGASPEQVMEMATRGDWTAFGSLLRQKMNDLGISASAPSSSLRPFRLPPFSPPPRLYGRNPRSAWDARNRPGSEVQSVVFDAGKWTLGEAKAWLRRKQFTGLVADRKANTIRFRQLDPGAFRRGSFRTIPFDVETGIQAVVGIPKR